MDKKDFILKYLHNELTDAEYEAFLKLVESDQNFEEQVDLESILYAQHKRNIKKELKSSTEISRLRSAQEKLTTNKSSVWSLFSLIRNSAAIFIVALVSYFLFVEKPIKSQDSSFQFSYYLKDFHHAPASLMNGNKIESNLWDIAVESYKQEKFELVIEQVEKISNKTNQQYLYLALSRLYSSQQIDSVDKAIRDFKSILSSNNSAHIDEARWFISIAYLMKKDKVVAKKYLAQIIAEDGWNDEKAAKLLEEISEE